MFLRNRGIITVGSCLLLFILLGFQMVLAPVCNAKLYTWKDRKGIIRRTYYPPPPDQVWKESQARTRATRASHPRQKVKVELFMTSWCPYCKKAIQFFKSKGIAVQTYDIEKDRWAAARKNKLDSRGGVPLVIINGTIIHGYSPEQYEAALQK